MHLQELSPDGGCYGDSSKGTMRGGMVKSAFAIGCWGAVDRAATRRCGLLPIPHSASLPQRHSLFPVSSILSPCPFLGRSPVLRRLLSILKESQQSCRTNALYCLHLRILFSSSFPLFFSRLDPSLPFLSTRCHGGPSEIAPTPAQADVLLAHRLGPPAPATRHYS